MNSKQPLAVTCSRRQARTLPARKCRRPPPSSSSIRRTTWPSSPSGTRPCAMHTFNDQIKQFHGNKARFDVGREWYALYPESNAIDLKPSEEQRAQGSFNSATLSHIRNFLECIAQPQAAERSRTGRAGDQYCARRWRWIPIVPGSVCDGTRRSAAWRAEASNGPDFYQAVFAAVAPGLGSAVGGRSLRMPRPLRRRLPVRRPRRS